MEDLADLIVEIDAMIDTLTTDQSSCATSTPRLH
jgi:hypothetical protein